MGTQKLESMGVKNVQLQPTAQPYVIVWRVLDQCNLNCPFCAYDSRLRFKRRVVDTNEVERIIKLIGEWQTESGRPVILSWLGGEPTLWRDLRLISNLTDSKGLSQSMTTNGTTLGSPSMRSLLLKQFLEVTISIDGFSEIHDELRGWCGAFEKLRRNIKLLAEEKLKQNSLLKIRANVVLMRGNNRRFEELCLELARWGIEEITYNQLGGRDRPEFYPDNRLRPEDVANLRRLLPELRNKLSEFGTLLLGGDPYVMRIEDSAKNVSLPIASCHVADNFLFIDESGVIAPCNFVGNDFGVTTHMIKTAEDFAELGHRLNQKQCTKKSAACDDCMSTQQFSKFDA